MHEIIFNYYLFMQLNFIFGQILYNFASLVSWICVGILVSIRMLKWNKYLKKTAQNGKGLGQTANLFDICVVCLGQVGVT